MGRRALWQRWVVLVTAGELAGFAVPAVVGIWSFDRSSVAQLVTMSVAGLVEGGMLGLAQAAVLRRSLPAFRTRAWVVATSLAAAVAWFLGMLPSTTHGTWSTWPLGWGVLAAGVLGAALLGSIGTAQALVMPRGTPRAVTWVAWTAAGWCAGLTAFGVVAPPLWHGGQAGWLIALIGLAGGLAMAVVMAAVTGIGVVRFVARGHRRGPGAVEDQRQHLFSLLLGAAVHDESGRHLGWVSDLVVDLARDLDRVPVTRVVIGGRHRTVAPWPLVSHRGNEEFTISGRPVAFADSRLGATELLLRRDILDSPVITADPPRRTRVSDVMVEAGPAGVWVTGVDVSPVGLLRRLLGSPSPAAALPSVPLSRVHLLSRRGHAAQLAVPGAMVRLLSAEGMAEVLTRAPVGHARDILLTADPAVREDAVPLLHPDVRSRVTGSGDPTRRTRRLSGWRLHRPGTAHRSGGGG